MPKKKTQYKQNSILTNHKHWYDIIENQVLVDRKELKRAITGRNYAYVIIVHNFINMLLGYIIERNFLKEILEVQKITHGINMAKKARLAYILNLIDKTTKEDLLQIQEIRNKFAHSLKANFGHKDIIYFVGKLSTAKNQKVTKENIYIIYNEAVQKCLGQISDTFDKQKTES